MARQGLEALLGVAFRVMSSGLSFPQVAKTWSMISSPSGDSIQILFLTAHYPKKHGFLYYFRHSRYAARPPRLQDSNRLRHGLY